MLRGTRGASRWLGFTPRSVVSLLSLLTAAGSSSPGAEELLLDGLHLAHRNTYSSMYLASNGVSGWPCKYTYSYSPSSGAYTLEFFQAFAVQRGCLYAYEKFTQTDYDTSSWDVRSPDTGSDPGGGPCAGAGDGGLWEVIFVDTHSVPYTIRLRSKKFGSCITSPTEKGENQLPELDSCDSDRALWEVTPCHCASSRTSCLGPYPEAPMLLNTSSGGISDPAEQLCCETECAWGTTTTTSTRATTTSTSTTEAPMINEEGIATAAIVGGVVFCFACCIAGVCFTCMFIDEQLLPQRVTSNGSFRSMRSFTSDGSRRLHEMSDAVTRSISNGSASWSLGMGGGSSSSVAGWAFRKVHPQPQPPQSSKQLQVQSNKWTTSSTSGLDLSPRVTLTRVQAVEMADIFIALFGTPAFQERLREALEQAGGDQWEQANRRREICDPIRLRSISHFGFPPSKEGSRQCFATLAALVPGDQELQEKFLKIAALVGMKCEMPHDQFVGFAAFWGLDSAPERTPPRLPPLGPLGPLPEEADWEAPEAPV